MMKNLFLIASVLFLFSCKKDKDVTYNTALSIISVDRTFSDSVVINWKATEESRIQNYEIQHGSDSITFVTFKTVTPTANNGTTVNYTHADTNPLSTENYYRIKGTRTDGTIIYSPFVRVTCPLNSSNLMGTYKITSLQYRQDASSAYIDILPLLDACQRDDNYIFNPNGILIYQDAGTVCVPAGDDSGTWQLTGNTLDFDGLTGPVNSFNCSGMTTNLTSDGVDSYIVVFVKQ